jgi:hypothetical protein
MLNTRRRVNGPLSILALMLLTFPVPAAAQRSAGPYAGVLGAEDGSGRHTLTVRGSGFGAWDETSSEGQNPVSDERFLRSGFAGGASAGLTHALRSSRNQWFSSANASWRAYSDEDAAATFTGRTLFLSRLSSRVSLDTSAGLTYSPYYEFAPSLDQRFMNTGEFGGGFGVATAAQRNTLATGEARFDIRLTRRDTFEVGVNGSRYTFLDQPDSSITRYAAKATLRHTFTAGFGVHAGYGRDEADYHSAVAPQLSTHTIDVGVDYGDTLQFSRRTALSFSSSTSAVRWFDETHYRLNASAALSRGFGRTGSGSVRYTRETDFQPGFREPLLTDTVSGGVSDQIGRSASWSVSTGYTRGTIGFDSEAAKRFNSINAGGRLARALTRRLGIFGDYTYYRYRVPPNSTVFEFLPKFSRHSVSVGLNVWVPLINDTRTPNPVR